MDRMGIWIFTIRCMLDGVMQKNYSFTTTHRERKVFGVAMNYDFQDGMKRAPNDSGASDKEIVS